MKQLPNKPKIRFEEVVKPDIRVDTNEKVEDFPDSDKKRHKE